MQKITPCLWFNGRVNEALALYTSLFPNSQVKDISRYGKGAPMPEGDIMVATFELENQKFMILNGGPHFTPNEAFSLVVHCETQAEIDHYWNNLIANGGQESMCGWLKDSFGISWQIVPNVLNELMMKDPSKTGKVFGALMQMRKIEIAKLEEAFHS
jgi:predicted 3-demethylubiquinone-9 3-methyltransferase (glyoxalase superfamily)